MAEKRYKLSSTVAWILFAATIVFTAVGLWIYALTRSVEVGPRWGPRYFEAGFALSFGIMGLLIVTQRPENRLAWFYSVLGFLASAQLFLENYSVLALLSGFGPLPLGLMSAWIASWIWVPPTTSQLTLFPLLFPNGRLISPRWRPLAWLDGVLILLFTLVVAFNAGPLTNFAYRDNPFGIIGLSSSGQFVFNTLIYYAIQFMFLPLILASVAAVLWRLKNSTGVERQQLKWFAFAVAGLFVGAIGGFLGPIFGGVYYIIGPFILIAAFMLIPILTGLAILRYRLWDIDLLIRKTVQYSLITGLLIVVYTLTIVLLQNLVGWLFGESSQMVIVISTLVIAILFTPIRTRVQKFVDRRFYRNKYNAESILAEFASAARDEMDLNRLAETVLRITDTTVKPAGLSLWLKKSNLH